MRRALVVSYFYPPFGSVGAIRVSKLTKYLPCHGWEASVLTTDRDDRPADVDIEIPADRIYRVPQSVDVMSVPRAFLGRATVERKRFIAAGTWRSHLLWQLGMAYRNVICF